jgi:hypothetical protein
MKYACNIRWISWPTIAINTACHIHMLINSYVVYTILSLREFSSCLDVFTVISSSLPSSFFFLSYILYRIITFNRYTYLTRERKKRLREPININRASRSFLSHSNTKRRIRTRTGAKERRGGQIIGIEHAQREPRVITRIYAEPFFVAHS